MRRARRTGRASKPNGMRDLGTEATTLRGLPVIVLTSVGARSGKLRKTALMRVEHEGEYAVVASLAGHRSIRSGTTT